MWRVERVIRVRVSKWGQVCRGDELWEVVGYMDLRHFASKSALTISVGSLSRHISAAGI